MTPTENKRSHSKLRLVHSVPYPAQAMVPLPQSSPSASEIRATQAAAPIPSSNDSAPAMEHLKENFQELVDLQAKFKFLLRELEDLL